MIFLHTTDMPGLISKNKLLSFLVIKFTPLFVVFLALSLKSPCYHGKGQHRNAVSIEILMVHTVIWCGATSLLQCRSQNQPVILRVLEQFCFFALPLPPHLLAW